MSSTSLREKLLWLIAARAAVITVLLGSAALIQLKAPGAVPVFAFSFLMALTYALTVVYILTLKHVDRHRWLADVQLACDALIVSAIVQVTGGITSYFSSLYTLPIIAASAVQGLRGGMMVGVLSSVIYGGLALGQYYRVPVLPTVIEPGVLPPLRVALFTVGLNAFGFIAVAGLSGYLAEKLRHADAQLERASSELADLQAVSKHIINSLTSGLATTDMTGRMMTFNRAAEAITGMSAADARGRWAEQVFQLPRESLNLFGPPETRPRSTRMEFGYARTDGRQIELGISVAPLMTPRGETGFLITFQDVTESRKRDREARVQQRLAAVGEMAAGIAHEIRNPLASMSGSLQILRQELPLTDEQGQLMDIVLRESERLNDTIRSFLAYARPQRLAMKRVDVRQLLGDTAVLLQNSPETSAAHAIELKVPNEPVWFQADENQIRQIVWNLATNGLRAMPAGGRLTLSVAEPTDDAPDVIIRVADEGVGIPAEEIEGMFQPFRGGFARGTGLGLSIVHRIVTDYGGEVKVSSTVGAGTTVQVKFPVEKLTQVATA
jgi:two-component system sensor histidine kinase PilS (NtrC family)